MLESTVNPFPAKQFVLLVKTLSNNSFKDKQMLTSNTLILKTLPCIEANKNLIFTQDTQHPRQFLPTSQCTLPARSVRILTLTFISHKTCPGMNPNHSEHTSPALTSVAIQHRIPQDIVDQSQSDLLRAEPQAKQHRLNLGSVQGGGGGHQKGGAGVEEVAGGGGSEGDILLHLFVRQQTVVKQPQPAHAVVIIIITKQKSS